jgi:hypothetical protein
MAFKMHRLLADNAVSSEAHRKAGRVECAASNFLDELPEALKIPSQSNEEMRKRLDAVLRVCGRFILSATGNQTASEQLVQLGTALSDLNSGTIQPLLTPSQDIARRDPSQLWLARAMAALALDAQHAAEQINLKRTRRDIAIDILRRYPGIKRLGSEVSPETLMNWRREFNAERIKDTQAKAQYSVMQKTHKRVRDDADLLTEMAQGWAQAACRLGDGVCVCPP